MCDSDTKYKVVVSGVCGDSEDEFDDELEALRYANHINCGIDGRKAIVRMAGGRGKPREPRED